MKIFRRKQNKQEEEQRNYMGYCAHGADASLHYSNLWDNQFNSLYIAAFFRCIDLISGTIAQLPVKIRVKDKEHTSELENHPILDALNHSLLTPYQLMKNVVRDVIMNGNGYIHIQRDGSGTVTGLRYLMPTEVTVNYDRIKQVLYYTAPLYYNNRKIEPINMLHFKMWSNDGVSGIGIARYMSHTLKLAAKVDDAVQNFYRNNMNLNGVLSAKQPVSEKQLQQIREGWNNTYNSGGGIVVLPNNLEYQAIQGDENESQSQREQNAIDICTWMGVSPILIGILTHSSNYSFEQARLEFLSNTIMSWLKMIEQEFNRKLLKPSEYNLTVDLDETAMLRADKQTLMSYYTGLIASGVLCINEARKELGYNPIDGGDKHLIPYTDVAMNTINNQNQEQEE